MQFDELWQPLPGSAFHAVSSSGEIRVIGRGGRILRQNLVDNQAVVTITKTPGSTKYFQTVKEAVMTAFGDPYNPETETIIHLDDNPMNCAIENLAIVHRQNGG